MPSAVYDNYTVHMGIGEIAWKAGETDIYCLLCNNTPPVKTHSHYSQVQGQLPTLNGYVQGGTSLAPVITPTLSSNVAKFKAANGEWIDSSFTAHYAIVYHNYGTPPLISYHDFGVDKTVTNGRINVEWGIDGVFKMTIDAQT